MTYSRVIPRDLFNEANLLKCLGRLVILLGDTQGHRAAFDEDAMVGDRFRIEQNASDGSISVCNLPLMVGSAEIVLSRPLNSREQWPLWASVSDHEMLVFDDDGNLSADFRHLIGLEARP